MTRPRQSFYWIDLLLESWCSINLIGTNLNYTLFYYCIMSMSFINILSSYHVYFFFCIVGIIPALGIEDLLLWWLLH